MQILPINPKLCQQELNETAVWLRILMKSIAIKDEIIVDILQENLELARIVTVSIRTAKASQFACPKKWPKNDS